MKDGKIKKIWILFIWIKLNKTSNCRFPLRECMLELWAGVGKNKHPGPSHGLGSKCFSQWENILHKLRYIFLCHLTPNYRLGKKSDVEKEQPQQQREVFFLKKNQIVSDSLRKVCCFLRRCWNIFLMVQFLMFTLLVKFKTYPYTSCNFLHSLKQNVNEP